MTGEQRLPASPSEVQVSRLSGAVIAVTAVLWATVPGSYLLIDRDPFRAAVTAALLASLLVLYGRIVRRHIAGQDQRRGRRWTFGVIVVVVYGGWPFFTEMWLFMPSIVGASATMLLTFRSAVATLVAVVAVQVPLVVLAKTGEPGEVLFTTMSVFATAVVQFGIAHYARLVRELRELRAALAEAALGQDRLRVARELHDLLGQTLLSITLKTELALALVDVDRSRVQSELQATVNIARDAQDEMNDVVEARRRLDVGAELSAAAALLELAGTTCALRADLTEIDQEVGDLLAWIVREAATNIVRHSSASNCVIELREEDGRTLLLMHNDGAFHQSGAGVERGSGLRGLRKRVERMNGVLLAGRDGAGGFSVKVEVPSVRHQGKVVAGDPCSAG